MDMSGKCCNRYVLRKEASGSRHVRIVEALVIGHPVQEDLISDLIRFKFVPVGQKRSNPWIHYEQLYNQKCLYYNKN